MLHRVRSQRLVSPTAGERGVKELKDEDGEWGETGLRHFLLIPTGSVSEGGQSIPDTAETESCHVTYDRERLKWWRKSGRKTERRKRQKERKKERG